MLSQIVCPACGLLMPAVPPGTMTDCPHCLSVYRVDEMHELSMLEGPKRHPNEASKQAI
jgi:hypothetical protein